MLHIARTFRTFRTSRTSGYHQLTKRMQVDKPKFRIQVVSDLHLELRNNSYGPTIEPKAPYLALLGDIGKPHQNSYKQFVAQQAAQFEKVFVVLGNHEYYGSALGVPEKNLKAICEKHPNVVALLPDSPSHRVPDPSNPGKSMVVIGSTLWSSVPDKAAMAVATALNDYHMISDTDGGQLTVPRVNNLHQEHLNIITAATQDAYRNNERAIVLTHHAPLFHGVSHPKYMVPGRDLVNHGFATDLSSLMGNFIVAWFYGHTHYNNEQRVNGTLVTCNQSGYNAHERLGFDPDRVYSL